LEGFTWRVEGFAWRVSLGEFHMEGGGIHLEGGPFDTNLRLRILAAVVDFGCGCGV